MGSCGSKLPNLEDKFMCEVCKREMEVWDYIETPYSKTWYLRMYKMRVGLKNITICRDCI